MSSWKDNVYFVLVEPKEPGNVGASARAIKNMGFGNLRLVNPTLEITEEGRMVCPKRPRRARLRNGLR